MTSKAATNRDRGTNRRSRVFNIPNFPMMKWARSPAVLRNNSAKNHKQKERSTQFKAARNFSVMA